MNQAVREALKARYLDYLSERPLLIGVEFEFPLVNASDPSSGQGLAYCSQLLDQLAQSPHFDVVKRDEEGRAIELVDRTFGDHLLYEVAYTTLEMAFAPVQTLAQVQARFDAYRAQIDEILGQWGLQIGGYGLHPAWQETGQYMVRSDRYEMLTGFLALSERTKFGAQQKMHHFPTYGGFIMGSQVQFDVSPGNVLTVLNLFNQIEPVKAYLFANSPFEAWLDQTRISRDRFWEDSMHGIFPENIGVFPRDFASIDDFLDYTAGSAMFYVERGEETLYFLPVRVRDYLDQDVIQAWNLRGEARTFKPDLADLAFHRAYHYQDLTARGTVELRSLCTQPLDQTWSPLALELGLRANLDAWASLMTDHPFFAEFGCDYPALRREFSKPKLSTQAEAAVRSLARDLVACAQAGLNQRGFGEELYLEALAAQLAE